jgi:hypothetical protein
MRQPKNLVDPSIRGSCIISALFSLVYSGCSTQESTKVHLSLGNSDAANQQRSTFPKQHQSQSRPDALFSTNASRRIALAAHLFISDDATRIMKALMPNTTYVRCRSSSGDIGVYPSCLVEELISPDSSGELFS